MVANQSELLALSRGEEVVENTACVKVMLRIRPRNEKEAEETPEDCWSWSDDAIIEQGPAGTKRYAYDRCFACPFGSRVTLVARGVSLPSRASDGRARAPLL